jgi:16S rRNA (uracil1498-N3)-methyltransferase
LRIADCELRIYFGIVDLKIGDYGDESDCRLPRIAIRNQQINPESAIRNLAGGFMSRRRFYALPEDINPSLVNLASDETHHLVRVIRSKAGDEVFVFDGCGNEYRCSFVGEKGGRAQLRVIEPLDDIVESPLDLTLAQTLAKGEKFDLIVQKATELGVRRIIPLATRYADVKLDQDQIGSRVDRWKRISLEALKQCGRRRLVEISAPIALSKMFESRGPETRSVLIFSEKGGSSIAASLEDLGDLSSVTLLIGPEGGWGDDELGLVAECGGKAVTLGPRILRTETAALAAITLVQHALGDLSPRARTF